MGTDRASGRPGAVPESLPETPGALPRGVRARLAPAGSGGHTPVYAGPEGPLPRRTLVRYQAWLPATTIRAPIGSRREYGDCLTPAALSERLEEEIGRAERHGTGLSCLLVTIDNLDELAREHGGELREQTIDYVAAALRRELRRFDRVGRVGRVGSAARRTGRQRLVGGRGPVDRAPGADSPRGEIVARRALERMRTIKVEAAGAREPLQISVGLAAWQQEVSAEALLARARAALRSVNGDRGYPLPGSAATAAGEPSESR